MAESGGITGGIGVGGGGGSRKKAQGRRNDDAEAFSVAWEEGLGEVGEWECASPD